MVVVDASFLKQADS